MTELSGKNFGLIIAYVIPGFVVVWGASFVLPALRFWLVATPDRQPTIAGFLYASLASLAAGVTVSALRWMIVDSFHHRTGLPRPEWNDADLPAKLEAFDALVENHYRYYQFYANMVVGLPIAYAAYRIAAPGGSAGTDVIVVLIEIVLFAGSRDALRRYYARASRLLGIPTSERSERNDQRSLSPQARAEDQARRKRHKSAPKGKQSQEDQVTTRP